MILRLNDEIKLITILDAYIKDLERVIENQPAIEIKKIYWNHCWELYDLLQRIITDHDHFCSLQNLDFNYKSYGNEKLDYHWQRLWALGELYDFKMGEKE